MKNYKKILAAGLAVSMVMGSSVAVFAAEGSGTGSGSLDVVEKSDVFKVELPTDAGTKFNYILDPTGVINETDAEKYNGATFASGDTVYFANVTETEVDGTKKETVSYSKTSDAITAVNKSTMAVTIDVTAKVAAVEGITMASSTTFTPAAGGNATGDATGDAAKATPQLYLAITDSDDGNDDTAIDTTGVSVSSEIAALDDAYEVKVVDGKYVKQLKADVTGFEEYSFQLTGACNADGDWAALKNTPPTIDVTWSIENTTGAAEDPTGPQATLTPAGLITVSGLTSDANIADAGSDIKLGVDGALYPMDATAADWIVDDWDSAEGGTLKAQLKGGYTAYNGQEVTVSIKLTNGETITCSATLDI